MYGGQTILESRTRCIALISIIAASGQDVEVEQCPRTMILEGYLRPGRLLHLIH